MTPQKQTALFAKHPDFFARHPDSPAGEGRPGITCGDGWAGIIDALLGSLTPLLQATLHLSNPPRLYEIGMHNHRLKVLLRPLTPEMAALIYQADLQSETVCEGCGNEKLHSETTLCPQCPAPG